MLDDKYWMDIGGMKSLGGGDFLPFRRLEASIRSASPNRVTRYTCCTGQSAKKISSEYTDSTIVSDNFCSGNTRVHLFLRPSIGYVMDAFTISPYPFYGIPLLRSEFTLNQDFLILSLEIRIVFSSFPFIIT